VRLWAILLSCLLLAGLLVYFYQPYVNTSHKALRLLKVEVEEGSVKLGREDSIIALKAGETAQLELDMWRKQPTAKPQIEQTTITQSVDIAPAVPSKDWIISGTVENQEGKVLPGAFVFATTLERSVPWDLPREYNAFTSIPVDRNGAFRIQLTQWNEQLVLGASMEGFQTTRMLLRLPNDSERVEKTLLLERSGYLSGEVKENITGLPIEGARLIARVYGGIEEQASLHFVPSPHQVVTDASGRFSFNALPPLGRFSIRISAPGYLAREVSRIRIDDSPLSFNLNKGGSLLGRVVKEKTGEVVQGAQLLAMQTWKVLGRTSSDASGEFRFDGLSPGKYFILARKGNWVNWRSNDSSSWLGTLQPDYVEVRTGHGPDHATVALAAAVTVSGTVRDRGSERPIANAVIRTWHDPLFYFPEVRTDAEGRYVMSGFFSGRKRLLAIAEDYAYTSVQEMDPIQGDFSRIVVIGDEDLTDVDFELEKALDIAGRVVNESGFGLEGVQVTTHFHGGRSRRRSPHRAYTDDTGRFEIRGLFGGSSLDLLAEAKDMAPTLSESLFLTPGENVRDIQLVLNAGGSVSGRVASSTGKPVVGIGLRCRLLRDDEVVWFSQREYTGTSGKYRLDNVPQGDTIINLLSRRSKTSSARWTLDSRRISLEPGETLDKIDFVYDETGLYINGVIVDTDNEPVRYALVECETHGDEGEPSTISTNSNRLGRFSLRVQPHDSFTLHVSHLGHQKKTIRNIDPTEELTVVLQASPRIFGRVVNVSGQAVVTYKLSLITRSLDASPMTEPVSSNFETFSNPEGEFYVAVSQPGSYRVEAVVDDGRRGSSEPIRMEEKDIWDVVIVVEEGHGLVGQLLDAGSGEPVLGARVTPLSLNQWVMEYESFDLQQFRDWRGVVSTDTEGFFVLEGLPDSMETLWISHPEYADGLVYDIDLEKNAYSPLRLSMIKGCNLTLTVVDNDGGVIQYSNIRVRFLQQGLFWVGYATGRDGTLSIQHAPPGACLVELIDTASSVPVSRWEGTLPTSGDVEVRLEWK
jgi:protocatechuate 3,4-dioxygenase beta subunit